MIESKRHVLVLNQFASTRSQAGGTRHIELFGRLEDWTYLILAADLNQQTGARVGSEPGFSTVRVPSYSSNGLGRVLNWLVYSWKALLLGLRQSDVNVVYGSSPHLLAPLAAWLIAAFRRVPFVLEVRDLWPRVLVDMGRLSETSLIYRLLTQLELFLYRRARVIVVMAEGSRTSLIERGVPADKIRYIPNGADPSDFVPSAPREELRRRYEFERFTAIYTGAHGPANGLNLLIDAASELQDRNLDIILVGGGLTKSTLVESVERASITNVRFLDPVPKSEIPDLLAAADLGVHVLADVELFQSAVSPNKLFDYMAAGLPVLTNCPGLVSDLVMESRVGLASNPKRLDQGLIEMLEMDPETRSQCGQRGQRWIQDNHSRSSMSKRLADLLRAL